MGCPARHSLYGVAAIVAMGFLAPMAAAGDDLDPARISWSRLSYRARKLTFTLHSEVSVEVVPSVGIEKQLAVPFQGAVAVPAAGSTVLLTLGARGLGRTSQTRLWIDSGSAAALQRTQTSRRKRKHRRKTLRFADSGVQMFFHRPGAGEDETRPELWTGGTDRFNEYPAWADGDLMVSEPTALFYLLATADLQRVGDRVRFPMFSRGKLIMMELSVVGNGPLKVDYLESSSSGERRVKGSVPTLKILVNVEPLDPDSSVGELDFMGLGGDVEILLDPATRAPLLISGRIRLAGRANVRIRRIVLE